jgi:hypothetical protein
MGLEDLLGLQVECEGGLLMSMRVCGKRSAYVVVWVLGIEVTTQAPSGTTNFLKSFIYR